MADASSSQSTAPAQDPEINSNLDAAGNAHSFYAIVANTDQIKGPSHAQESAPVAQTTTYAKLPLRQSRHPIGGIEPKVHDVTEKFTRACSGKFRALNKMEGHGGAAS